MELFASKILQYLVISLQCLCVSMGVSVQEEILGIQDESITPFNSVMTGKEVTCGESWPI